MNSTSNGMSDDWKGLEKMNPLEQRLAAVIGSLVIQNERLNAQVEELQRRLAEPEGIENDDE